MGAGKQLAKTDPVDLKAGRADGGVGEVLRPAIRAFIEYEKTIFGDQKRFGEVYDFSTFGQVRHEDPHIDFPFAHGRQAGGGGLCPLEANTGAARGLANHADGESGGVAGFIVEMQGPGVAVADPVNPPPVDARSRQQQSQAPGEREQRRKPEPFSLEFQGALPGPIRNVLLFLSQFLSEISENRATRRLERRLRGVPHGVPGRGLRRQRSALCPRSAGRTR